MKITNYFELRDEMDNADLLKQFEDIVDLVMKFNRRTNDPERYSDSYLIDWTKEIQESIMEMFNSKDTPDINKQELHYYLLLQLKLEYKQKIKSNSYKLLRKAKKKIMRNKK